MKQLPIALNTINGGDPITALFNTIVPAGSWAQNKAILIRGCYQLVQPALGGPPFYSIGENIGLTGLPSVVLPTGGPFMPAPGTASTYIERVLLRVDPNIIVFDRGAAMQSNYANNLNNTEYVYVSAFGGPPIDYTVPIGIDLLFDLSTPYPGLVLTPLWGEAFLEQGTNLGTLA